MDLLEREPSLALLAGYAAEARRGDGRLVLVGGEAGVGKTALLERFHRDLPDARWFWGACDGLFTPRPLGPLYDLADQFGGELLELCARGADREELFRALLRQAGAPGPLTVVVVEDVHWADEAAIDLLRFAGRRLRDSGVLLVVTYRDDDLTTDDPLRVALGELTRQRTTRRISLPALSAAAVASSRGSAPVGRTPRSPRSCSSRPRPSITTSPPCSPSWARQPQRRRGEGRRTRPGQLKHRLPKQRLPKQRLPKQRLIRSAAPRSRTGPGGRPGPARRAAP
jgi:predicted ATPase